MSTTKRPPSLKRIADYVNGFMPGYTATIERGYCNTDRHPKGVCWRIPGKGREGNRIIIRKAGLERPVVDHNAAETYRSNREVMEFLERGWYRGTFDGELNTFPEAERQLAIKRSKKWKNHAAILRATQEQQ